MVKAEGIKDTERLRRLEAVTDMALSRMPAADLLDELLDRIRDLLGVDTAVILLVDAHSRQLVATASYVGNAFAREQLVHGLEPLRMPGDRKSTRLNSSHAGLSRMPSSA